MHHHRCSRLRPTDQRVGAFASVQFVSSAAVAVYMVVASLAVEKVKTTRDVTAITPRQGVVTIPARHPS